MHNRKSLDAKTFAMLEHGYSPHLQPSHNTSARHFLFPNSDKRSVWKSLRKPHKGHRDVQMPNSPSMRSFHSLEEHDTGTPSIASQVFGSSFPYEAFRDAFAVWSLVQTCLFQSPTLTYAPNRDALHCAPIHTLHPSKPSSRSKIPVKPPLSVLEIGSNLAFILSQAQNWSDSFFTLLTESRFNSQFLEHVPQSICKRIKIIEVSYQEDFPLASASFDFVTIRAASVAVPEDLWTQHLLPEIMRVCKGDGLVEILTVNGFLPNLFGSVSEDEFMVAQAIQHITEKETLTLHPAAHVKASLVLHSRIITESKPIDIQDPSNSSTFAVLHSVACSLLANLQSFVIGTSPEESASFLASQEQDNQTTLLNSLHKLRQASNLGSRLSSLGWGVLTHRNFTCRPLKMLAACEYDRDTSNTLKTNIGHLRKALTFASNGSQHVKENRQGDLARKVRDIEIEQRQANLRCSTLQIPLTQTGVEVKGFVAAHI